ncbi:hypothetical protein KYJ26_16580 [Bacillus sp. MCCB 382]|nr:hypothetical protein [Bacillus sp. MCCB 382]
MLTGAATTALMLKALPYIVGMKVVGGIIDIGIHAVKCRIGGERKWR